MKVWFLTYFGFKKIFVSHGKSCGSGPRCILHSIVFGLYSLQSALELVFLRCWSDLWCLQHFALDCVGPVALLMYVLLPYTPQRHSFQTIFVVYYNCWYHGSPFHIWAFLHPVDQFTFACCCYTSYLGFVDNVQTLLDIPAVSVGPPSDDE